MPIPTSQVDFAEQAALVGQGPGICMVAREDMLKLFAEIERLREELQRARLSDDYARQSMRTAQERAHEQLHRAYNAGTEIAKRLANQLVAMGDVLDAHGLRNPQAGTFTTF